MQTERIQAFALFGLLGVVAVLAFFIYKPFLMPLALAAIFAVILQPVYKWILRRMPKWRGAAALITILLAVLCLLIPFGFLIGRAAIEAEHAYVQFASGEGLVHTRAAILAAGDSMEPHVHGAAAYSTKVAADLNTYVTNGLHWFLNHLGVAVTSIAGVALDTFIFLMALYAFLKHGPVARETLTRLSPFKRADDEVLLTRLEVTINSVIRGSLTTAALQGLVAGLGYWAFGVPSPLLWGVATAFAALIPGVGTILAVAPAILYLVVTNHLAAALGLLAWGALAIGTIDNFIGPLLVRRGGVHLPSLVILLSVLGGTTFFGPAGVFLGPLTISLLAALFGLYSSAHGHPTD